MNGLFGGIFCILMGCVFLWFSTEQGHLTCQREPGQAGTCVIERSNIYGHRSTDSFTTDQLQSVRGHTYYSRTEKNYTQICLHGGRTLLISNEFQGSRAAVHAAAAQLNAYKNSPEQTNMEFVLGADAIEKWYPLIFVIAGIALLFKEDDLNA